MCSARGCCVKVCGSCGEYSWCYGDAVESVGSVWGESGATGVSVSE